MDAQQAQTFTQDWLNAFNQRDLDAILFHYAEDVEFQSPLAVKLLGEASGAIKGKENLRKFIEAALAAFPGNPDAEILAVFLGVNSLVVQFQAKGRNAAEVMEFDPQGKIRRAMVHGQM